ncbi:MAG TPA: c-type cytochrome [Gammaproteobacteria bacterium]|nr:c-type cytochrome [Gammaproteobacteria bacterium]
MCSGCHGIADYRTAYPMVYPVPRIGGQDASYMVKALQEYKAGDRKHPTMQAIAATLSDQDMANVAAYYAGLGTSGASAAAEQTKVDATCVACHGAQGSKATTPQTPRLAGQQRDYLVQALTDYRKKARSNVIMAAMAAPLTDEQIRELAAYYSLQQGLVTEP